MGTYQSNKVDEVRPTVGHETPKPLLEERQDTVLTWV